MKRETSEGIDTYIVACVDNSLWKARLDGFGSTVSPTNHWCEVRLQLRDVVLTRELIVPPRGRSELLNLRERYEIIVRVIRRGRTKSGGAPPSFLTSDLVQLESHSSS